MECIFVETRENHDSFGIKHFRNNKRFEKWLDQNDTNVIRVDYDDSGSQYTTDRGIFVARPVVLECEAVGMVDVANAVCQLNSVRFGKKHWQRRLSLRDLTNKEARSAINLFCLMDKPFQSKDTFFDLWLVVMSYRINDIVDGDYSDVFSVHVDDWSNSSYVNRRELRELLNDLRHFGKAESVYEITMVLIYIALKLGYDEESISEALLDYISQKESVLQVN